MQAEAYEQGSSQSQPSAGHDPTERPVPPVSAVATFTTPELRIIVRGTNPDGRFAAHVAAAKAELARRVGGYWQVKDYADGWIDFDAAEDALREVEAMGEALVRFVPPPAEA